MTVTELTKAIGTTPDNIRKMLGKMYGCYIDRWVPSQSPEFGGSLAAVWKTVEVPENAPDPSGRVESLKTYNKDRKERKVSKPLDKPKKKPLPQPVSINEKQKLFNLTKWITPPPWASKER
jgi:hypothetical protein